MRVYKGVVVVLTFFFALLVIATEGFSYTITGSVGPGGSISPSGPVTVAGGADQTFYMTPDTDFGISEIFVDGAISVPPGPSYTFSNVTADHSITAFFSCNNSPAILVSSGSSYSTVTEAYGAAGPDDTIKLRADFFNENLSLNSGKKIMLDGGYNCSYQDNSLVTRIPSLTVADGTVVLSNIVLSASPPCEPGDPNNFPGNTEICDGLDNNCDGSADDGLTFDNDHDGYSSVGSCGGSADDCNDNDPNIHPYGEIYGDELDQDCDGKDLLFEIDGDCFTCHAPDRVNNVYHHATQAPDSSCVDCHAIQVTAILPGHYGQTVRTAGNNMAVREIIHCTSCHDWHEPSLMDVGNANIVWAKAAVTWNPQTGLYENLTCDNCHENRATSHTTGTAHDNRLIDATCGNCHTSDTSVLGSPGTGTLATQADIDILHRSDCTLCHNYSGTKIWVATVRQAIESGLNGTQITCTDCHTIHHSGTTNKVSYNSLVDTSQSSQQGCAVCHQDYDLANGTSFGLSTWETILVEHDLDGTKDGSTNTCANCHAYDGNGSAPLADVQNAIASGGPVTCASCHTDKVPDVVHGAPTSGKHPAHLDMAGVSCSTCHSNAPYFKSGTDSNDDGLYELTETNVCDVCHQDWVPGLPPAQDYKTGWGVEEFTVSCQDCHAEGQDNGDNLPVGGRRAVIGEFPNGNAHAHYGTNLDPASCQVCHDYANHMNGTVKLLDPDGGAEYNFISVTDIAFDPDLSNFCANCHDDNGAARLALLSVPLDPFDPFANGNAPPDVATRFKGTLQWNEYYGDFCFGYEGSNRPVNSHHDISDADQAFSGAKLECLNCHGAHTAAASQKVNDPFNSNLAWTGTLNEFCLACHAGGHEPMYSLFNSPSFPAEVVGPTFYTPPPANAPGDSCGADMFYDCGGACVPWASLETALTNGSCDDLAGLNLDCFTYSYDYGDCGPVSIPNTPCGTDMVWDCDDSCIGQATVDAALVNGICDEAAGSDFSCGEFNFDHNSCNPCIGNNCSTIGGIDSCNYDFNPWYIDVSWANEAHGGDSKRDWAGYSGAPPVPEMECVVCHDSHGSYDATTNPGGNPYMLRDYVDGTQFIDDGVRPNAQWTGPPWDTTGTAGSVVITSPTPDNIGPQLGNQLCVKCHTSWVTAYDWHDYCSGCLSCHSHGQAFGANDWGVNPPDDTKWCP